MKKVLEIKEVEPGILKVRLEATKRRTFLIKLLGDTKTDCCNLCPLTETCTYTPSPLIAFAFFSDFCSSLFVGYPDFKQKLKEGWGIEYSTQFVMYKP